MREWREIRPQPVVWNEDHARYSTPWPRGNWLRLANTEANQPRRTVASIWIQNDTTKHSVDIIETLCFLYLRQCLNRMVCWSYLKTRVRLLSPWQCVYDARSCPQPDRQPRRKYVNEQWTISTSSNNRFLALSFLDPLNIAGRPDLR